MAASLSMITNVTHSQDILHEAMQPSPRMLLVNFLYPRFLRPQINCSTPPPDTKFQSAPDEIYVSLGMVGFTSESWRFMLTPPPQFKGSFRLCNQNLKRSPKSPCVPSQPRQPRHHSRWSSTQTAVHIWFAIPRFNSMLLRFRGPLRVSENKSR